MNKIFNYALAGASLLVMATSCSSREEVVAPQENPVTLTVNLPERLESTRSFGDGTTAQKLTYAVYDGENRNPVILATKEIPMRTTVDLRLVKGKTYTVIFWAQNAQTDAYTFDEVEKTVSVDYDKVVSNDELRDAFYAVRTYTVTGPINDMVYLYRPCAQINLGCDELNDNAVIGVPGSTSGLQNLEVSLTTQAYTKLDLISGLVSGQQEVTFAKAPIPTRYNPLSGLGEKFPVEGYEYLNMNYMLVPADKSLVNCDYKIYDGTAEINTLQVLTVPVQRNWQTNIYGRILTSDAVFNVEIAPVFKDKYDVPY